MKLSKINQGNVVFLITLSMLINHGNLFAQTDLNFTKDKLIKLETESWEAWKNRDGKFYETFLSGDHVEIGFSGVSDKAEVVASVSSKNCVVKNYTVNDFSLTLFDNNTALLTYKATQETICSGKPLPTPIWISSPYQKRNNKWLNVAVLG